MEGGEDRIPLDDTLDEPVGATIWRDAKAIGTKLSYVIAPRKGSVEQMKQWDLFGPLILCLTLASVLSLSAPENQASLIFASVFVIVWVGCAVVTLNAQLLGGNLSFFQCVCVLGYSVFPLVLSSIFCLLVSNTLVRAIIVVLCLVWSCFASMGFLWSLAVSDRRGLTVYPVVLFYSSIAWIVVAQ